MDTDECLKRDVLLELSWESEHDTEHVDVSARNGAVTLAGRVPDCLAKLRVAAAATRAPGVRAIANELELPPRSLKSDEKLAQGIAHSFETNSRVPDSVTAEVTYGWVGLFGTASSREGRYAAECAAQDHEGVRGVHNMISVVPPVVMVDASDQTGQGRADSQQRSSAEL